MSDFITLLINDLVTLIAMIGIFIFINYIWPNRIKDPITRVLHGVVLSLAIIGFSGSLATHYGNIYSIKARIIAAFLMCMVMSVCSIAVKVFRYERLRT